MRVVRLARLIVPASRRDEWTREWEGELWYRVALRDQARTLDAAERGRLLLRTLGAFPHALWALTDELRIEPMLQDIRYALRSMAKRPAFAALVTLILALGIGANSAMFSIVNSVLLRPLPYENPHQLVYLYGSFRQNESAMISPPDFLDYRERNSVFSSLAARTIFGSAVLSGSDDPERVTSSVATANYFATLGVAPYRGRAFLPEEENGSHDVVILSFGLWQRRFAGDPAVIGTATTVDGRPHTIVGVMPPLLDRTHDVQLWRPIDFHTPGTSTRRFHFLRGLGRLAPGVSLAQAQNQMDVIARQLEATYPENETWKLRLVPYRDVVVGDIGPALWILLGAVGVVLLIACGNVASLLLARATARGGEIAIRTALGASRMRLVRQLLTESLVLGAGAGAAGLVLAFYLVQGARAVGTDILPRVAEVELDGTAVAFTFALSLVTSLAFGLAPVVHAVRRDLAATMTALGKGSSTRSSARARGVMVVAQVALSFVLLVGAGLLIRSLSQLQRVEPGFDADGVFTAQIALPSSRYRARADVERFWTAMLERVRAIPGVEAAAATTLLPMRGGGDTYFHVEGRPPATDAEKMNATIAVVTDDYFSTMGIRLVAGRAFTPGDVADAPGVTVINAALAERLFPGTSAIGERLVVDFGKPFTAEIVGVVGDVRVYGQAEESPDMTYFSIHQPAAGFGAGMMQLVARARDAAALAPQVRAELRAIEPSVPLASPETMQGILRDSVSEMRFRTGLLTAFAAAALLLAVVGLYGVLAYSVTQRAREIGIRIALGAGAPSVFRLVVGEGMLLVAAGIVAGLAASLAATGLLASMLFDVGRTDPPVFAGVTVALFAAGLAACLIPARRAMKMDPIVALRAE